MAFNPMLLYHYMAKALSSAEIVFPTTKALVIKSFGNMKLKLDVKGTTVAIKDIVERFPSQSFENAEGFMCAFTSYLMQPTWKEYKEKFFKK